MNNKLKKSPLKELLLSNPAVQSALIEGQYYNDDELVVTALRKEISNNA